jgi:hypothetical protein
MRAAGARLEVLVGRMSPVVFKQGRSRFLGMLAWWQKVVCACLLAAHLLSSHDLHVLPLSSCR